MDRAQSPSSRELTTLVVTPEDLDGDTASIGEAAYRHLFRARRLAVGARLRLVDGRGRARWARVTGVDRRRAEASIGGPAPANEPPLRLELLVAPPRPARASVLVEKCTELGVHAVRFIVCQRAMRTPSSSAVERLRRVARAAVEQCHRSWIPEVSAGHRWEEIAERLEPASWRGLLDPGGGSAPAPPTAGAAMLVVGPEGGFTEDERARWRELGCVAIALGPRILRVETAALVGSVLALRAAEASIDTPSAAGLP